MSLRKNGQGKVKKVYKKMPINVSIHLRFLHQDMGLRIEELLDLYKEYPKTSIIHHAKKNVNDTNPDKRKFNKGRPKKLYNGQRGIS